MAATYTGKVTYVLNADTLHILMTSGPLNGEEVTLRVCDLDTYEERGKSRLIGEGLRSTVYNWLPASKKVKGTFGATDTWGRVTGSVIRDT